MEKVKSTTDYLLKNAKVAIPSLIIGGLITFWIFNAFIIYSKDATIAKKKAEIESLARTVDLERASKVVQEERLKVLGDRVSYLKEKIEHKPEDIETEINTLRSKINQLEKEKTALSEFKNRVVKTTPDEANIAQIQTELSKVKGERDAIKKELSKLINEIIVKEFEIREGKSWTGFGGKVTLGLIHVNISNDAEIVTSFDETKERKIMVGERLMFTVDQKNYILIVDEINYVGSNIIISVYSQ